MQAAAHEGVHDEVYGACRRSARRMRHEARAVRQRNGCSSRDHTYSACSACCTRNAAADPCTARLTHLRQLCGAKDACRGRRCDNLLALLTPALETAYQAEPGQRTCGEKVQCRPRIWRQVEAGRLHIHVRMHNPARRPAWQRHAVRLLVRVEQRSHGATVPVSPPGRWPLLRPDAPCCPWPEASKPVRSAMSVQRCKVCP